MAVPDFGKVFYPVFPPDKNAARVVEWLDAREGAG